MRKNRRTESGLMRLHSQVPLLLLGLGLAMMVVWGYLNTVEQAKQNYYNESHNLAVSDLARIQQKLEWFVSLLNLTAKDELIKTFVAAGETLPPMAEPRIKPAFQLLEGSNQAVSLHVVSLFDKSDRESLLQIVSNDNTSELLNTESFLAVLEQFSARFKSAPDSILGQRLNLADEDFLVLAKAIRHRDRVVGYVCCTFKAQELKRDLSPLARSIKDEQGGWQFDFSESKVEQDALYGERLTLPHSWSILFARPNQEFWKRTDVLSAKQAAVLRSILIALALLTVYTIAQRRSAQAASRAKSDFMAGISHDIRTPLNAVIGLTELTLNTDLGPAQREYLQTVSHSAKHVVTLLDDLLTLSRMEAQALELRTDPVELKKICEECVASFQALAKGKNLILELECGESVPSLVAADKARLRQLLNNLISNAIKFTNDGTVTVRLLTQGPYIQLVVQDSGIGIAADHQAIIFQAFQQASTDIAREFGGTGLGLAICKKLADQMNGHIKLESALGKGSTFTVELKLKVLEKDEPKKESEPARNARILIADDGPINRKIAALALEELDCEVVTVGDGAQAVEAMKSETFDMVVLDIHMPVMDGLKTARELRKRKFRGPILALTGQALGDAKKKCLKAGMNDFIAKPIDEDSLRNKVGGLLALVPSSENSKTRQSSELFDLSLSLQRVGGDPEKLGDLMEAFLKLLPQQLKKTEKALESEQREKALSALWALLAPFSFPRQLIERLQTRPKDDTQDSLLADFDELKKACQELSKTLEVYTQKREELR